jgi:hypothetical protein
MPVEGGEATEITTSQGDATPSGWLVVEGGQVYWSSDGGVQKAPVSGGDSTVLAPCGATSCPFDVESGCVFYIHNSALKKIAG